MVALGGRTEIQHVDSYEDRPFLLGGCQVVSRSFVLVVLAPRLYKHFEGDIWMMDISQNKNGGGPAPEG